MPIETCEEDEDFGRDCDAGDRDEDRCDQCGQTSGCLLNGLCPMCHETGGGVLHRRMPNTGLHRTEPAAGSGTVRGLVGASDSEG